MSMFCSIDISKSHHLLQQLHPPLQLSIVCALQLLKRVMETSGIIVEKFIKFLTNADLMSDELLLPEKILSQYVLFLRYVEIVNFEMISNASELCENVDYYFWSLVKNSNIELCRL
ncbi:hypothetical protein ACET3Z_023270 [Daucus carota]